MTIQPPTEAQVKEISRDLGFSLSESDVDEFTGLISERIPRLYGFVDALPDLALPPKYSRTAGVRPGGAADPLNAWYIKVNIKGAAKGRLAGRKVVLKDNICLAGVPMMNGASTLASYVPDIDATIVTRILDAGGEIVGKANCEYLCYSGGSHTNATGPTHNPYKRGWSAGGSSSGCAALVGGGEVELAVGSDQGGSIREPASFCGCYGMKPTHGLVPYTGAMPIELTLDHLGPMSTSVAGNALLLEVLAGEDGLDPRQSGVKAARYCDALDMGVQGLRIGIVREGFRQKDSMPEVDRKVSAAAEQFARLGAQVGELSIPLHSSGLAIWGPIAVEGSLAMMMKGNGFGTNWKGLYVTSLIDAHAGWRTCADALPDGLKLGMIIGEYMQRLHAGRFYGKAQNAARALRASYDEALDRFDLLLMPTVPVTAPKLPPDNAVRRQKIGPGSAPIVNTAPFDVTGHPAMSVPCGFVDGLPVGMMLVARHWNEATIYRAARAYEASVDWRVA
jgi:amidase